MDMNSSMLDCLQNINPWNWYSEYDKTTFLKKKKHGIFTQEVNSLEVEKTLK